MAKCPFCAEDIAPAAVKCKHCGEWLSQPVAARAGNARQEVQALDKPKDQGVLPYVLLGLAVLYAVSPIDIIPDVPVVGWFDDFFVVAAAALNVLQHGMGQQNRLLVQIVGLLKWGVIAVGAVLILLVLLLGAVIIKLFSS